MSVATRIGRYIVERELGHGGMGVVYLARDPNLLRHVAIKVLPESLISDPTRLERFREEARLLASLHHPNIAVVHTLEQDTAGSLYLVMEHIEGHTLARRIRQEGPLPVAGALAVCREIARAVAAAHASGVIHRDLKPDNVMIDREGVIKVLDFGLSTRISVLERERSESGDQRSSRKAENAREGTLHGTAAGVEDPEVTAAWHTWIWNRDDAVPPPASGPSGSSPETDRTGSPPGSGRAASPPANRPSDIRAAASPHSEISGTPAYLSPELIRTGAYDHRADIFAFGCVLYECLAGRRAFGGRNVFEVVSAVLHQEPDWTRLPADLDAGVAGLLRRCLAKDPSDRPDAMAQVAAALEQACRVVRESSRADSSTPAHNLPHDVSSFVGRAEEIETLRRLLEESALVTLTGAGGSGKTRLSVKVGLELLSSFPDGVWLVELATVTDACRLARTVAGALGIADLVPAPPEEDTIAADAQGSRDPGWTRAVLRHLETRQLLLILDNCEHLVAPVAAFVHALLRSCPRIRVLTTSQEVLGLAGEVSFAVPPLGLPGRDASITLDEVLRTASGRLFFERARAVAPDLQLTDSDAPYLARICRHLDGVPLALELAAARVRVLSLPQIEARLGDRFRLLTTGDRAAPHRHQTLRAALDWSYGLLNEQEQGWLRSLSVFSGGWSLEGAVAIGGPSADELDVLEALARLVEKSLVLACPGAAGRAAGASPGSPSSPRYRMLETIRQYGRLKLEESGEAPRVRDQHLQFYLDLVEAARVPVQSGPTQREWLDRLDLEHANLLEALDWAAESDGPVSGDEGRLPGALSGLKLSSVMATFWHLRGHAQLACTMLERALQRDAAVGGDQEERPHLRAAALNAVAHFQREAGNYERARQAIEEAVRIRREVGPPLDLARTLFTLAAGLWAADRIDEAAQVNGEVLEIARELGNDDMTAAAQNAAGAHLYRMGDLPGAIAAFHESLSLRREMRDQASIAMVLGNLGTVLALAGDLATSRRHLEEALAMQREMGNQAGVAGVLENLGNVMMEEGETASAEMAFREGLAISIRLGQRPRVAGFHTRLASLHLRGGAPASAVCPLRESLCIHESLRSSPELAETLFFTACREVAEGRAEVAARLFGAGESLQGDHGLTLMKGDAELIARCRAVASQENLASAVEDGRRLRWDEALREALRTLATP